MKKYFFILMGTVITVSLSAQTGGKKREHRNQKGGKFQLFSKNKSRGNANAFAKGSSKKKGLIAKLFSGNKVTAGGWIYHKTPGSHKTDHSLFHRFRTKNKVFKDKLQARINKNRVKSRKKGNTAFSKRKY